MQESLGTWETHPDSFCLGWGLRGCISTELPVDVNAADRRDLTLSIKVGPTGHSPGMAVLENLHFACPPSPRITHSTVEPAHLSSLRGSTAP